MSRDLKVLERHFRHWRQEGLLSPALESQLRDSSSRIAQHAARNVGRTALAGLRGGLLLAGLILIVAENWEVLHRGLKLGAWALLQLAFLPEDTSIDARSTWVSEQEVDRLLGAADVFAGSVQVGCCAAGDVHRVCALARPEENRSGPARYWCKGFATLSRQDKGWKLELDLGLRRFFIPNRLQLPAQESREGWELEVSHRPGLSPLPRRLFFQGTPIDVR